jgi:hypothetical protein
MFISLIAIFPLNKCLAVWVIMFCIVFSFLIPLGCAKFKRKFKLKTIGKSDLMFEFADLFDEDCFVVTTTRYFDVNPYNGADSYTASDSLVAKFVDRFFPNDIEHLESLIKEQLQNKFNNNIPVDYGESIKIYHEHKIIYFLAFTDRLKSQQPEDFYIKTMQKFLKTICDENHGKRVCFPLIGDNNNISDSGFINSEISFKSLIAMINNFEIVNNRSRLKLKIVALPEKRTDLINVVSLYSKYN